MRTEDFEAQKFELDLVGKSGVIRDNLVTAVFDYCLTRSFDLWPLNAIGAISLLSPDYLVPFIEEKVDHFRIVVKIQSNIFHIYR